MILMMVWQWDVDGDGIPDHLQRQPAIGFTAQSTPAYVSKAGNPLPTQKGNFYNPADPK